MSVGVCPNPVLKVIDPWRCVGRKPETIPMWIPVWPRSLNYRRLVSEFIDTEPVKCRVVDTNITFAK